MNSDIGKQRGYYFDPVTSGPFSPTVAPHLEDVGADLLSDVPVTDLPVSITRAQELLICWMEI